MMPRTFLLARLQCGSQLGSALAVGLVIALLMVNPAPLLPIARAYRELCEQYPPLALLTFHASPVLLAFLLGLAGLITFVGVGAAVTGLVRTHRFNQRLRRGAMPMPPQLVRIGTNLSIADQLSYQAWAEPAACCYGFLRPRIAITAGLLTQLDDEELTAVIAHERQHLRCRDPLRFLVLHTLTAAAFMFPVVSALQRRHEARIELAADRASLTVAPRGALAGALLAVLNGPRTSVPGAAGLTATESRIAQLSGRAALPEIPVRLVIASLGLTAVIALAAVDLAASADLVEMICEFCVGTS